MGYNITDIDGDLAVGRNAEIGGDTDIKGGLKVRRNVRVEGFFDAPNIKGAVKGLFVTEDDLKKEYPNPRPGWFAVVLDQDDATDTKGFLYLAARQGWVKTGEESRPMEFIKDSINVFASKEALDAENTERKEVEQDIKEELDKTLKYTNTEFNHLEDVVELECWDGTNKKHLAASIDAATETAAGVMSAEDKVKLNASIKNVDVSPNTDNVELGLKDNTDRITPVVFPAATTEKAGVMSAGDKFICNSFVRFSENTDIGGINAVTGKDTGDSGRRRTGFYKFTYYYIKCNASSLAAYLYDKDKAYLGVVNASLVQKSEIALQQYPTAVYVRFSFMDLTSVIEDGKLSGISDSGFQERFYDYDIELNNIYGIFNDTKAVSPLFTKGQILAATGENAESSSRRRTDEYYYLPLSLECSDRNLIIYCYDENKTYLGYIGTVANINDDVILSRYPNTVYVRFSIIDLTSVVTGFATSSNRSSFSQQLQDIEGKVNTKSGDILSGKKWAVCGDSFSKGDFGSYDGVTSIETGKYAGKPMTYGYIIGNRCNMEIFDNARGGMTIANPADGTFTNSLTNPASSLYYKNIPEDVDYITLYYGINDSHHASQDSGVDGEDVTGYIPVGAINDSTNTSFYGAWNEVLEWLITNRPFAKIGILVSNGCDTPEYRTATIAIARKWGIPFIDLNGDDRTPMMLRSQNPDISNTVKAIRYAAQRVSETNGHPSPQAHEYESTFIENFLRSL